MEDRIIKVTRQGGVLLDGEAVELDQLEVALAAAREEGARAVYYREAPFTDPEPAVMRVVERIVASKVRLATCEEVPSEWGMLGSFAVYEAPDRFRLAATRGGEFDLYLGPVGTQPARHLTVELPRNERLLHQLDLLLRSDRVLEMQPHEADKAFDEVTVEEPSVHVRAQYLDRGPWASFYRLDECPSELRSLVIDCNVLARRILREE